MCAIKEEGRDEEAEKIGERRRKGMRETAMDTTNTEAQLVLMWDIRT